MSAGQQIVQTTELIEKVLLCLPLRHLLLASQTHPSFHQVIEGSNKIRKALWLAPSNETFVQWQPKQLSDGSVAINGEAGEWQINGEKRAALPLFNPFLTVKRVAGEDLENGFHSYDKLSVVLAPTNSELICTYYDGNFNERLHIDYHYHKEQASAIDETSLKDMQLLHPPCKKLRLLHASVEDRRLGSMWFEGDPQQAEVDLVASEGIKVGLLAQTMLAAGPTPEDQAQGSQGFADMANRAFEVFSSPDVMKNLSSLFASMGTAETDSATREDAFIAEQVEASIAKTKTASEQAHDSSTTAETEHTETHIAGDDTAAGAGMAEDSSTQDDEKEQATAKTERKYNLEFCLVGGTYWGILQDTIDEITGWEMLEILDMSTQDLAKLRRIR